MNQSKLDMRVEICTKKNLALQLLRVEIAGGREEAGRSANNTQFRNKGLIMIRINFSYEL